MRAVGKAHAARALHLHEEQFDGIEIDELEIAALERALVDLLARVEGHEPVIGLAHRGKHACCRIARAHLVGLHRDEIVGPLVGGNRELVALDPRAVDLRLVIAGDEAGLRRADDAMRRVVRLEEGTRRLARYRALRRQGLRRGAGLSGSAVALDPAAGAEQRLEGGGLIVGVPALDVGKAHRREADARLFHAHFPQQKIERDGDSDCAKQQCTGDGAVERGSAGIGFSSPIRSRQASSSDSWRKCRARRSRCR